MWCLCYLLLGITIYAQAQVNLFETVRTNQNTTEFANLLEGVGLRTQLEQSVCNGGTNCLTLLAPNNGAVNALMQKSNWASLTNVQKLAILTGHIIWSNKPLTTSELLQQGTALSLQDVGFGTGRQVMFTLPIARYIFQRQLTQNITSIINSAVFVSPNIASTNGMVHVLDEALYTPISSQSFIHYLLMQTDLQISAELWMTLLLYPQYATKFGLNKEQNSYGTYFVVTDQGWSKVPQEQMTRLRTNISLLAEVLSYQYFPNQLVYSQWTNLQPQISLQNLGWSGSSTSTTSTKASMLTRSATGQVFIMSGLSSAQVVGMGETINQAIVHKVSESLGFIYETRDDVLRRINPNFLSACQADTVCNAKLMGNQMLTFFVPSQSSWPRFNALNTTEKTLLLKYMVISGTIDREQMLTTTGIEVDGLPFAIRFRTDGTDLFVDGRLPNKGYVGAKLTLANQVAVNGIAHAVDGIPGLVYQTVMQYIAQNPMYSKYNSLAFVQTQQRGGPYIFLCPTNDALTAMENDATVGSKLLADTNRRNYIFRRHTFPLVSPFEYLSPAQYLVPTANLAFTNESLLMSITVPSNGRVMTFSYSGVTTEVWSKSGGFQFTDGILYQLNKLIYAESDLTRSLCTNPHCQ